MTAEMMLGAGIMLLSMAAVLYLAAELMALREKRRKMTRDEAIKRYHEMTDHARDGSPLAPEDGASMICNCALVVDRLIKAKILLINGRRAFAPRAFDV